MGEVTDIGHNTERGKELREIVDRIERLESEKQGVADDIKEYYADAKGKGFDTKIIRKVIRLRKMEKAKREEERELTETYLHALGML